ncbi:hypothetical protein KCP69_13850 [Salmonella enterica subsp. enterica]|nr:hypothetical protein KCP69_13850 [Salmonella enterica subsp. enterica]
MLLGVEGFCRAQVAQQPAVPADKTHPRDFMKSTWNPGMFLHCWSWLRGSGVNIVITRTLKRFLPVSGSGASAVRDQKLP